MDFFVVCRRRSLKFPRCLLVRICTLQSSLVRRSYVARVPNRTLNTRVTLYTGRYCSNLEEKDRRLMTARDTGTNDDGQSETTLKPPRKYTSVTFTPLPVTKIVIKMLSRSSSIAKTLISRTARRGLAARSLSSEATEAATSVSLNFSVPYDSIYNGAQVEQVIIPGTEGEYGVTANHVPYVAQMKPGILTVMFDANESEKYFVAGGYAVTHANSVTVSK